MSETAVMGQQPVKIPETIAVIISELRWVHTNARRNDEGDSWICNHCGPRIESIGVGRSLWEDPKIPCGGWGEVIGVRSLYCPACHGKPAIDHGEPIYRQEIVPAPGKEFC